MKLITILSLFLISPTAVFGLKMFQSKWSNQALFSKKNSQKILKNIAACSLMTILPFLSLHPSYALEQQYKLPPIDRKDTNRCILTSSAMGQANAARDKLFDLRECDIKGQDGAGKDMSGIVADNSDFTGVNFKEAQLSKGIIRNSKFAGCDFTNAVVDRASFEGSDLTNAIFANAVLSGTTFVNANLKNTDFTDSYLGPFDLKNLCLNPTLDGKNSVTGKDSRESAGCF